LLKGALASWKEGLELVEVGFGKFEGLEEVLSLKEFWECPDQ
jgi:hypothetical protein